MIMGKSLAGKHSRNPPILSLELAVMETLHQLKSLCHLYGTPEQPTTKHGRIQLFCKAKNGLEMLPPTRDALELHAMHATY